MTKKKQLNLFIDTNVLLGFYRYSADDLNKLNQLEDLIVKTRDINLIVTSQQVDEFYRNRDKVISEVVKVLTTSARIPELFSGHTDYPTIKKSEETLRLQIEKIKAETLADAKTGNLKADQIIARLFNKALPVTDDVLERAKKRAEIGNPPGKPGSIGDAINWELLLTAVPAGEDLHLVSRDSDFASALDKTKLDSFLQREWDKKFSTEKIYLHETLNGLFKAKFPDIKLIDEYIKDDLIRQLSESPSFDNSRKIINRMLRVGSFSKKQITAIFIAATTNDQVYNAHTYSPELVGDKLWQIIEPYWSNFSTVDQQKWMESFPDDNEPEMSEEISF